MGELCLKFLNHFGSEEGPSTVNLEECVNELGIERRRIYDIVNILESFEMIKRTQKNQYELEPPSHIKLRIEALELKGAPPTSSIDKKSS